MGFTPFSALLTANVVQVVPSGDSTGVSDAANITAAIAALPAAGGTVQLAPGQFYIEAGQLVISQSGIYLQGAGKWATYINGTGTGDVIRMYSTAAFGSADSARGGGVSGVTIDGTNCAAGSAGLHIGDILQLTVDVAVNSFSGTGSIGVHFDNQNFWTEQAKAWIYTDNCTAGVVFDCSGATTSTGSFARGDFDIFVNQVTATNDGVVWQNGAQIIHGRLKIYGNFVGAASGITSACLRITGSIPSGHPGAGTGSTISFCDVQIGAECAAAASNPVTIAFGSSINGLTSCAGVIAFFSTWTSSAPNVGGGTFIFAGPVSGDNSLVGVFGTTYNLGNIISASTQPTASMQVARCQPSAAVTGIILGSGTVAGQRYTLINESANTITFAAQSTSHVAGGTNVVIAAQTAQQFIWDTGTSLWYPVA